MDWQTDIDAAHAQLLTWMDQIGAAKGWSRSALEQLHARAEEALDAVGWWFPTARDYWEQVGATVTSWPAASGLTSAQLPGWDGFLDTVASATGAAVSMEEAVATGSISGIVQGTVQGSLEDAAAISETAQEAVTDPGSSPLAWGVGGLLVVSGIFGLARLMGR